MPKDGQKNEKNTKDEEREGVSRQFIEKIITQQKAETKTK